jgi:hypothetical protein
MLETVLSITRIIDNSSLLEFCYAIGVLFDSNDGHIANTSCLFKFLYLVL